VIPLIDPQGGGLLEKNVLAGLDGRGGDFYMGAGRHAYRNGLDSSVLDHPAVIRKAPGAAEPAPDGLQARRMLIGEGDNLDLGHTSQGGEMALLSDPAAADHSYVQRPIGAHEAGSLGPVERVGSGLAPGGSPSIDPPSEVSRLRRQIDQQVGGELDAHELHR